MNYNVEIEAWPIAGDGFTISRETKRDAIVVHVTLERDGIKGNGECVPLKRYHHTPELVKEEIETWLQQGLPWARDVLHQTLKAGPARFALDTAMWEWEATLTGQTLWQAAGIVQHPATIATAFTLSGAAPDVMAEMAKGKQAFRWLKVKLMGDGVDLARVEKIHQAAPQAQLIVDANEALAIPALQELLPAFERNNVVLIEQPLLEGDDEALRGFESSIPLAADESCHTIHDLEKLHGKYQVVNLKLDKTGGLTHALDMAAKAREMGFGVMIGCMASTSLSIYPACIIAAMADFVDLDGALLLKEDRAGIPISYRDGLIVC